MELGKQIMDQEMHVPWKWIFIYVVLIVGILYYNNALKKSTYREFIDKFQALLEEMALSSYFRPCGYPIELVARLDVKPESPYHLVFPHRVSLFKAGLNVNSRSNEPIKIYD